MLSPMPIPLQLLKFNKADNCFINGMYMLIFSIIENKDVEIIWIFQIKL